MKDIHQFIAQKLTEIYNRWQTTKTSRRGNPYVLGST